MAKRKRASKGKSLSGRVISKRVSPGSKSDRVAVCLETEDGDFILRRKGGNPFRDSVVESLVGKKIDARGLLTDGTLIMEEWEEEGGDP